MSFWCYDPLARRALRVNPLRALESGPGHFWLPQQFLQGQRTTSWPLGKGSPRRRWLEPGSPGTRGFRPASALLRCWSRGGSGADRVDLRRQAAPGVSIWNCTTASTSVSTFPYTGQTTSLDAFWMGVPVVSLVGNTAIARAGLSLLASLGLPGSGRRHAGGVREHRCRSCLRPARFASLRESLRQRLKSSALMDPPRFARGVEEAYREMWRRCARGVPHNGARLRLLRSFRRMALAQLEPLPGRNRHPFPPFERLKSGLRFVDPPRSGRIPTRAVLAGL